MRLTSKFNRVLDKKLKALDVNSVDVLQDESRNKDCKTDARIIILGEGRIRSQYAPKSTVKILKRPDRNIQGDGPHLNGDKPKQPIKSLKQREQEYAEARKRILGEEKSPDEKLVSEINRIQGKTLVAGNSNLVTLNITRMPTGPDGTKGFNVRR
ncbi:PREDICTED: SUZ domain-containing protein 1 isoform X2 [Ceratosolen solmsi marchali]|uniref:SUZ RNA-binding domain-containing n=1 Tax=Ceratosolen solmsi marchali TaxID=326594 RepID=A0AAJ6YT76_9HYME|nr:PREDICTED: SUZ domain-containing protein 1 isoform X2 [Ceratosolen solmsi marchali]